MSSRASKPSGIVVSCSRKPAIKSDKETATTSEKIPVKELEPATATATISENTPGAGEKQTHSLEPATATISENTPGETHSLESATATISENTPGAGEKQTTVDNFFSKRDRKKHAKQKRKVQDSTSNSVGQSVSNETEWKISDEKFGASTILW